MIDECLTLSFFVLVADYGSEGQQIKGVFSTIEKAKAAGFDANLYGHGRIIQCSLDELIGQTLNYVA